MLGVAHISFAQDLTIDDFTTGKSPILHFNSGSHNGTTQAGDPSHLIGGTRSTNFNVSANPLQQISTFQFRPDVKNHLSAFIHNASFYAGPRVDMGYGSGAPMHADFSSYRSDPHGLIRVNFLGLTENLNFNIQLYTGTTWAQGGCNISAYPGAFSVELPLDKFDDKGINYADVNYINVIFQSSSPIGAIEFAVTSVEVSKTPKPGAVDCHFPF
jgi:hypothetical protein